MPAITLEDYQIRIAREDESEQIINILKEAALWIQSQGIDQWQYLLQGGDDEEIKQAVCRGTTYIVVKGDKPAATFALSSEQNDWDRHIFGNDAQHDSLYLHRLAVKPDFMKNGLGAGILKWIENHITTDKKYLKLDCVGNNQKLNEFYLINGFEHFGITDGHSKYRKILKR